VFFHLFPRSKLHVISRLQSRGPILFPKRGSPFPELSQTHTHLSDLGQVLGADHSTHIAARVALLPKLRLYATHILATKATLLNMSRALNREKASGQINLQTAQVPSRHATGVSTQESEASSQADAIARNVDFSSATSTTHPSKEALSSPPTASSATDSTVFPFFRLPRELRDEIYIYASMTENAWIGRPPRLEHTPDDVIAEKNSVYQPTTLIKTDHSIVGVSHQARDEFRAAAWRKLMTENVSVLLQVYDFDFDPLEELFANCSSAEVTKLQETDKCRVHHHLTAAFHWYRRGNRLWELIQLFTAWLKFNVNTLSHAKQSIDKCDWYDTQLLRTTMQDGRKTGDAEWDAEWQSRWDRPFMLEFWDVVTDAHEKCSAARNARRNAFHKLAPLGQ